jgi:hypothetical protein
MKKIYFLLTISLLWNTSYSQIVQGVSPASNVRTYNSEFVSNNDWGTPDMTDPINSIQAELVLVEDGTPGLNAQGNPISQEGCNTLTNPNDVNGNIAVIYRGNCGFGSKH